VSTIYTIVKELQTAPGNIAKQSILDSNKDNLLFKAYMQQVYDVGINYYQSKLPKGVEKLPEGQYELDWAELEDIQRSLAERRVTGKEAQKWLTQMYAALDVPSRDLLGLLIKRSIGASVGDTMVLKTWPDLYFIPPYQRCSLLDAKARERFGKLKRFYVQTKADGSFAYVVKRLDGTVDVITRQGSKYPQWFAEHIAKDVPVGSVIVGELLVDEKQDVEGWGEAKYHLDRKTANGLLNSALKDGEKFDLTRYSVYMQAWDMLTQEEFEAGKSDECMINRYARLDYFLGEAPAHITSVGHWEVSSLEEAFAIYQEHLQRGLEGCIIKDPDSLWKDGTAKDIVKLKIKFMVDMRCVDMYEGEGKAAGMLGGIYIQSEDGGIYCGCGSGFNDADRKFFWENRSSIIGFIVEIEANDITQSRDERKKPSLSLPIFCGVRLDKTVADTAERVYAQLEAAKQGG
jgi:DNA ligase-1